MEKFSVILFFYLNYISSFFYPTKILLIITNNYKITILVENHFVLSAYIELFVCSEAVGIENLYFTKTEQE